MLCRSSYQVGVVKRCRHHGCAAIVCESEKPCAVGTHVVSLIVAVDIRLIDVAVRLLLMHFVMSGIDAMSSHYILSLPIILKTMQEGYRRSAEAGIGTRNH